MNIINKIKIFSFILVAILFVNNTAFAQLSDDAVTDTKSQAHAFQQISGYEATGGTEGVSDIIARVIFIALSILASIFVILVIVAGFQWMTAGGNEEKISKAKKNISNAVIGLIIVLSAYAITWFIFTYLPMSAGTGGGGGNNTGGGG